MKKIFLSIGVASAIPLVGLTVSCSSSSKTLVKEINNITYVVEDGKLSITYHYNNEASVYEVMDRTKIIAQTEDDVDKQIASYFPLIDNADPEADIYTNIDTNELFKIITLVDAPEEFTNEFSKYQSGELQAPVAQTPQVDENGNIIHTQVEFVTDINGMTPDQAIAWKEQYDAYKTMFNVDIHVRITDGPDVLYDQVWIKGIDRAHSNYGRGMNIDIYGPGDDFYDAYYQIIGLIPTQQP